MPRNRSEIDPHREMFLDYAKAVQEYFDGGGHPSNPSNLLARLWDHLPDDPRNVMANTVRDSIINEPSYSFNFRRGCIDYIKDKYGEADAA